MPLQWQGGFVPFVGEPQRWAPTRIGPLALEAPKPFAGSSHPPPWQPLRLARKGPGDASIRQPEAQGVPRLMATSLFRESQEKGEVALRSHTADSIRLLSAKL